MNSTITDERLKEILDGCEGVTPGPYEVEQTAPGMCDMYVTAPNEGARRRRPIAIIAPQKREENAFHFARLDPTTVASIVSELLAAREALRLLLCIDFDRGTEHDETLLDDVLRQARALSGNRSGK